jgi:transposase
VVRCWDERVAGGEEAVVATLPPLDVSPEDRVVLERWLRAQRTEHRMVTRARVVLMAGDGHTNRAIATATGLSEEAAGRWRRRYARAGLSGLKDRKRSGRPPVYGHDERLRVVATVTETPPDPAGHWTHQAIADRLSDTGISADTVGTILKDLDLKPHLVRGWLTRKDTPEFWERALDVCGLYLDPPDNALVLSVDEKTAISARSPKHRTRPPAPGRLARREFEYLRHGTACLMAALDVHSGQVLGSDASRNDAAHFIAFLDEIDAAVPSGLAIHLVLDNGSSHVAKATRAWLTEHPRFHVHHTPPHASWLNQVELFFSILARRLLKHGEFTSRADLVAKIIAFIADYDLSAGPFRWTYDGKPLKAA